MMKNIDLDAIDRQILEHLQADASRPVAEIAERVGLSTNPCWRRIRRMEEQGIITRRTVLVDPAKLGLGLIAFVTIKTDHHDKAWLRAFADAVDLLPEIVECHRMTGDVDYMLKVVVRDVAHYDDVYQRLLEKVPGLRDVSSTFSMEMLKRSGIPTR